MNRILLDDEKKKKKKDLVTCKNPCLTFLILAARSMTSLYTLWLCTWRCSSRFLSISSTYSSFSLLISASFWMPSFLSSSVFSAVLQISSCYTGGGRNNWNLKSPVCTGVVCELVPILYLDKHVIARAQPLHLLSFPVQLFYALQQSLQHQGKHSSQQVTLEIFMIVWLIISDRILKWY